MKIEESDIKARIRDIDIAIEKLRDEQRMLQNLLLHAVMKTKVGEVKDSRSYRRIYNEEKIKQALNPHSRGLKFKDLAASLRRAGVIVKDETLRSYLTRMGAKGEIRHDTLTKAWRLVREAP